MPFNRISDYKEITTENPSGEVWKALRIFLDEDYTARRIRQIHNPPEKQEANVRKQAVQLTYCIRQAEEYFLASTQVGMATRPNLLYYGAACLSQALVLLNLNGEYSFDNLRAENKHKHHGLEFKLDSIEETKLVSILSAISCLPHFKRDGENQVPWGQFANFYRSLIPGAITQHYNCALAPENYELSSTATAALRPLRPIDQLGHLRAIDLLVALPDLYNEITRHQLQPTVRPVTGNIEGKITRVSGGEARTITLLHHVFVNEITPEQIDQFVADCRTKIPNVQIQYVSPADRLVYVLLSTPTRPFDPTNEQGLDDYPQIVDNLRNKPYVIVNPDSYVAEPAVYLMLLFMLGMFCRYFPDVWMRLIDSNIGVTELFDSFLNYAYRKFPNLILDQMTLTKHHIHL
jgi:hypothetical protein